MKEPKENYATTQLPESEVIHRILDGEKELYEVLLRRNNQKLFRVIRSYVKDAVDIEDVMQNTYLKAYEKLYQFKHNAAFSTWLIRIGINEALKRIKETGRLPSTQSASSHFESKLIPQQLNRNSPTPEERIIQQETKLFIERAIDTLAPNYKVVFILKEVEGMSIADISECLDLSISNVKVRLHRAKAILKNKLSEIYASKEAFEFGFSRCDNIVEQVIAKI